MKVRIQRASESPVNPEEAKMFSDEFAIAYDKAEIKAGKKAQNPQQHMLKLQRYLRYIEYNLKLKYKLYEIVEMPTTAKAWCALITKAGSAVLVATAMRNDREIVLVIMDAPLD